MITKFKLFEEEKKIDPPKYKIGDYVEVDLFQKTDIMHIIDIDTIIHRDHVTKNDIIIYQYECEIERNDDIENEINYILEQHIIRKLTLEEVELHKNMNKYNL